MTSFNFLKELHSFSENERIIFDGRIKMNTASLCEKKTDEIAKNPVGTSPL